MSGSSMTKFIAWLKAALSMLSQLSLKTLKLTKSVGRIFGNETSSVDIGITIDPKIIDFIDSYIIDRLINSRLETSSKDFEVVLSESDLRAFIKNNVSNEMLSEYISVGISPLEYNEWLNVRFLYSLVKVYKKKGWTCTAAFHNGTYSLLFTVEE